MSSDSIISVENLGKRYIIGHELKHDTLRDRIAYGITSWAKQLVKRQEATPEREEFWALNDISFNVKRGEVMGIIGRNGAGKSTLLKVLSRITEPTKGKITLDGRVASLLEVGTGFHPELSGRENIFLNGAILGMSRAEIKRKFDEIVAFAEVDRFIDTPVKRYSSGMYVRLAFAVAAHLEPEILIVDEVLAVGDHEFQQKCLGRMGDISKSGRTVLFVSHNLEALRSICQTGLLLESGRVKAVGEASEVIAKYHRPQSELEATFPIKKDKPCITSVSVDPKRLMEGDLVVQMTYQSPFPLRPAMPGFILNSSDGRPLFGSNMRTHPPEVKVTDLTSGTCILEIPKLALHSDTYSLTAWLGDKSTNYDSKAEAVSFPFVSSRHYPERPPLHVIGPLDLSCKWSYSNS